MHSYRFGQYNKPVEAGADNSRWFEYLGLQSSGHGPQAPIAITNVDKDSPILKGQPEWTTINEEHYNNVKIFDNCRPLQRGKQVVKDKKSGKESTTDWVVTWTSMYKNTRVFSTTIGHVNPTVADARYLDLVTRGLLWACDKLTDDGKIAPGYEAKK
jgi:type 1 glutamine amidotransferase